MASRLLFSAIRSVSVVIILIFIFITRKKTLKKNNYMYQKYFNSKDQFNLIIFGNSYGSKSLW
jgi:hypothetical protein